MKEKIKKTDEIQKQVNDLFKNNLLVQTEEGGVGVNPQLMSQEYQQWHEKNQPAVIDENQGSNIVDPAGDDTKAKTL